MNRTDWRKRGGMGHYRVVDKDIKPYSQDSLPAVVKTEKANKEETCAEIAQFVHDLKMSGKIEDYNQVAFLFPSLKSEGVKNTKVVEFENALNALGIPIYAPRAGRFLEVEEASQIFGLMFVMTSSNLSCSILRPKILLAKKSSYVDSYGTAITHQQKLKRGPTRH